MRGVECLRAINIYQTGRADAKLNFAFQLYLRTSADDSKGEIHQSDSDKERNTEHNCLHEYENEVEAEADTCEDSKVCEYVMRQMSRRDWSGWWMKNESGSVEGFGIFISVQQIHAHDIISADLAEGESSRLGLSWHTGHERQGMREARGFRKHTTRIISGNGFEQRLQTV